MITNISAAKIQVTNRFDRLVILSNPASTQAAQSAVLAALLTDIFGAGNTTNLQTEKSSARDNSAGACQQLVRQADILGPRTLLVIAGGDGTVNQVVNTLLCDPAFSADARRTVVLPLWGGNANDLAYMLNGPAAKADLPALVQHGKIVAVYPISVGFRPPTGSDEGKGVPQTRATAKTSKTGQKSPPKTEISDASETSETATSGESAASATTRLAVNYVSFGASAAAAHAINHQHHRTSRLHRVPGGRVARELLTIATAMIQAPRFRTQDYLVDESEASLVYEKAFINGSRFAKVDRVALELSEPRFSAATVQRKRPASLIYHTLRLVGRRYHEEVTATEAKFTVLDPVVAQIDGESIDLPAGTRITVQVFATPLYALSSRLH